MDLELREKHERAEALALLKGADEGDNFSRLLNEGRSLSQRDRLGAYMSDIQKTTHGFPDVEIQMDKDGHLEEVDMKRSWYNPLRYIDGETKEIYKAKHDPKESVNDPDRMVIYELPWLHQKEEEWGGMSAAMRNAGA